MFVFRRTVAYLGLLVSLSSGFLASPARAQTNWLGVDPNNWNDPANWSSGIPGVGIFTGTAPGTIDLTTGSPISATGLTFNAGGYTLINGSLNLSTSLTNTAGTNVLNSQFTAGASFNANFSGGNFTFGNTAATPTANSLAVGNTLTVGSGATLQGKFAGSVAAAGSNALSSASVVLTGGVLALNGVSPGEGLTGVYYAAPNGNVPGFNNREMSFDTRGRAMALLNTYTPATLGAPNEGFSASVSNVLFSDTQNAPFGSVGFSPTNELYGRWIGKINITEGGTYTFGTRSDDGSNLYINGVQIVGNNSFQGMMTRTGTVTLTPGAHLIEVNFYEGGGGAGIGIGYSGADNGSPTLDNNVDILGTAAVQIPLGVLTAVQARANLGNDISVTNSSTVTVDNALEAILGTLTVSPNQMLMVNGIGMPRFTSTTLAAGASAATFTFNTAGSGDLALGAVSNASPTAVATLVKLGAQNLILDGNSPNTGGASMVYRVTAGRLAAVVDGTSNPLGPNATVEFNGGSLYFRTRDADATLTGVGLSATAADGTIEAVNTNGNGRKIRLTGDVTLANNRTISYSPIAPNMLLSLDGAITGAGNLVATGGNLDIDGTAINTFTGNTRAASGGNVVAYKPSSFGTAAGSVTVDGGGTVLVYNGITMANAPPITINGNGSGNGNGTYGYALAGLDNGTNTYGGNVILGSSSRIGATNSTFVVTGTVAIGGNTLTVAGQDTMLNGSVGSAATGAALVKDNAGTLTLAGPNTFAAQTTINAGVVNVTNATGLGSSNVTIPTTGILRFTGGAGTAGGSGTAVTVLSGGRVEVASGTGNLTTAAISLNAGSTSSAPAGLREVYYTNVNGNDWLTTTGTGNTYLTGTTSNVRMGQNSSIAGAPANWSGDNLWVYTGQVKTAPGGAAGTAILSFAEQVDDRVFVRVNGAQVLNNTTWNQVTAGNITGLNPDTWYDIEIRLWNGGGGAGPPGNQNGSMGWSGTYGFGLADTDTANSLDGGVYFKPGEALSDPLGTGRFQTLVGGVSAGTISIAAGSRLQAGSIVGGGVAEINGTAGNPGVLQLVDAAGATADALNTVALLGTSATGTLTVGTNHTLTVNSLNLASGGTLTKDGSGTLVVSGTPATGNTGVLTVAVGTLTGTGTVAGPVSISSGATVSPGTSIPQGTTLTVGPTAFAAASTLRTTLFGTGSTEIGLLSSTGAVSVNSTAGIVLDLGAVNADSLRTAVGIGNSRTYTVAQGVGSVDNFTTSNLTLANQGSFQSSEWSILGSPSPGNVQLLFTPVPEPVTILGVGAILLGVARLRRRTGGVQ